MNKCVLVARWLVARPLVVVSVIATPPTVLTPLRGLGHTWTSQLAAKEIIESATLI